MDGLEFWDRLSFLKAGINFSDAVTTVSPTYAEEIQTPEYGFGFDGVIRARARRARSGILNGIDYDEWNPARDPLPARSPSTPTTLDGQGARRSARCSRRSACRSTTRRWRGRWSA